MKVEISEEKEFYNNLIEHILEAQESLSEAIQHLDYMQAKLGIVNTLVLIKKTNDEVFSSETK